MKKEQRDYSAMCSSVNVILSVSHDAEHSSYDSQRQHRFHPSQVHLFFFFFFFFFQLFTLSSIFVFFLFFCLLGLILHKSPVFLLLLLIWASMSHSHSFLLSPINNVNWHMLFFLSMWLKSKVLCLWCGFCFFWFLIKMFLLIIFRTLPFFFLLMECKFSVRGRLWHILLMFSF